MKKLLTSFLATSLAISACSPSDPASSVSEEAANTVETQQQLVESGMQTAQQTNFNASNPFFAESDLYLKIPAFDKINNEHYAPAFAAGMTLNLAEVDVIANNPEPATIDNTLIAFENSGAVLDRVSRVFFALASANLNDEIDDLRGEMAPKLSAHSDSIRLNGKLFKRVKALYEQLGSMKVDAETARLVSETYKDFVRLGADLSDADKEKLKAMNYELATLETQFTQNLQKEVNAKAIIVEFKDQLAGLSDAQIASAELAAKSRDMEGKFVLPLLNNSGQPVLASLRNRALRERIHKTSLARGSSGGEFDNREILSKVAKLRAQRAQLMGFANHAAYSLSNKTAQTTKAVNDRLAILTPPAVANAKREAADLQKQIDAEGGDFQLASWDWSYYAEKVRAQRYNFDESNLRPYLEMENVLVNGVFYAAEQVFGITFKQRPDLKTYHPDVKVWEVFDADGSTLALFIQDFYARESKRGGAWANAYVSQSRLKGNKPVVANHLNVSKPAAGEPTLLTWKQVTTMFHEFGHALHHMFSDVTYPSFAGTSVPRDFVEYPSKVNEMWADWPQVLANYAVHYKTGDGMPRELLDKVLASSKFNQGFTTTEYLAAALLDQAWHQITPDQVPDVDGFLAFEAKALENAGVGLDAIPPRYRSTYFRHIIGAYSAGYYSYIWSEVLDADSVEWFKENGGMKRKNGDHFRKTLLSRGGAEDAMVIFKNFRGAEPNIQPLLVRKGLIAN